MKARRLVLGALGVVVLWGAYLAYRAHTNLVTLSVRDMEVRRVVSKLRWQTWERIEVNKNVGGKVTLNVRRVPLEEVLNIIGLQTDSRWLRLYPIYSTPKSIQAFHQVLLGQSLPAASGWGALLQLAAWQQGGALMGFANTLRAENKLVSAQLANKDMAFTALALSRFSKAQVVPEDGVNGKVNLTLQQVPFDKAVAKVAKQVHRNWDRIYTLQPRNAATVVRQVKRVPGQTNAVVTIDTNPPPAAPTAESLPPDQALEAIVSTMTPEERQQTMDLIAGANQNASMAQGGGQQAMSPEAAQAAQAAAQAAKADLESRIDKRLKDGTIDQRLAHDRRVLQSQQAPAKK